MVDWLIYILITIDLSIREFNDLVNMSASDLEDWLESEASESAGWRKSDGSGETIGHERYLPPPTPTKQTALHTPLPFP